MSQNINLSNPINTILQPQAQLKHFPVIKVDVKFTEELFEMVAKQEVLAIAEKLAYPAQLGEYMPTKNEIIRALRTTAMIRKAVIEHDKGVLRKYYKFRNIYMPGRWKMFLAQPGNVVDNRFAIKYEANMILTEKPAVDEEQAKKVAETIVGTGKVDTKPDLVKEDDWYMTPDELDAFSLKMAQLANRPFLGYKVAKGVPSHERGNYRTMGVAIFEAKGYDAFVDEEVTFKEIRGLYSDLSMELVFAVLCEFKLSAEVTERAKRNWEYSYGSTAQVWDNAEALYNAYDPGSQMKGFDTTSELSTEGKQNLVETQADKENSGSEV